MKKHRSSSSSSTHSIQKLPRSIYVVFTCTVVANVAATIIVLKFFL